MAWWAPGVQPSSTHHRKIGVFLNDGNILKYSSQGGTENLGLNIFVYSCKQNYSFMQRLMDVHTTVHFSVFQQTAVFQLLKRVDFLHCVDVCSSEV